MFKLIRNGTIYAPEPIGVKDLLICGEKILKIERASWKQAQLQRKELSVDPGLAFFWNGSRQIAKK